MCGLPLRGACGASSVHALLCRVVESVVGAIGVGYVAHDVDRHVRRPWVFERRIFHRLLCLYMVITPCGWFLLRLRRNILNLHIFLMA